MDITGCNLHFMRFDQLYKFNFLQDNFAMIDDDDKIPDDGYRGKALEG